MSHFKTWDANGKNLVDSDYVTFGLTKSGYMQKITDAQRRVRLGLYTGYEPVPFYDEVYGFTVTAETPIVFIAGQAVIQQIVRSGNEFTFWYGHSSASARFYVFDRMTDRGAGPAKLRLWTPTSVCTLDSGMPFMDIDGSSVPPSPVVNSEGFGLGYAQASVYGGTIVPGNTNFQTVIVRHSVALPVDVNDCAVSIPWTRAMFHGGKIGFGTYSAREGAFGSGGNVVFMMATEAGANINSLTPTTGYDYQMSNIPVPRKPTATYIDASTLPMPFDVTGL